MIDANELGLLAIREWLIGEGFTCGEVITLTNRPNGSQMTGDRHFTVTVFMRMLQIYVTGTMVEMRESCPSTRTQAHAAKWHNFDISHPECFPQIKARIEGILVQIHGGEVITVGEGLLGMISRQDGGRGG
jgi:hypothetical protein